MFGRDKPSSVLCPSCGSLVGINDVRCLICGRARPGLFGLAPLLRLVGRDVGFETLVMWACGALYIASLAVDSRSIETSGLLSFLSPSNEAIFLFGGSGALPVFRLGRWWTVLSAGWLHGGVLHIAFNMMALRNLGPLTAHLYGTARTVIIYTVASVVGFLASSAVGYYLPFLPILRGGVFMTLGASAALFGLIGALLYYGRRGGSRILREAAARWALGGLAFGFFVPGIDNWAHIGGLAGGYLAARWLDPLLPERGDHVLIALFCLLLSAGAIIASVVVGLPPGA
jgi:rhomboid protease GluP